MRRPFCFVLLLLMLLVSACTSTPPEQPDPAVPFKVLDQGDNSGVTLQKVLAIYSVAEFAELWQVHARGQQPLPAIDFQNHMVLGIFWGQKHTGGYSITVSKIEQEQNQINVYIVLQSPAPGTLRTMALTQPYLLLRLPRTDLKLNYHFINQS